ncbi:MAG: hypothetical protein SF187_27815 [Deltaproteobacteria bacterium]|nr:hypothetical protein [Deltaproteobacteria bacterium]
MGSAKAATYQRSWNWLTTGNGHGFALYDANTKMLSGFLEHPYRFLRPGPTLQSEGPIRRDLAFEVGFGVRGPKGNGWLRGGTAQVPEYIDDSNIIRAPITLSGQAAESIYFAPFGYEGNAVVALLKAPGATHGTLNLNFRMGAGTGDNPPAKDEKLRLEEGAVVETGSGTGAMIYLAIGGMDHADCGGFAKVARGEALADDLTCTGDVAPTVEKALGADGWMGVMVGFVDDATKVTATITKMKAWLADRQANRVLTDAQAEWEAWRKPIPNVACTDAEKRLWRQMEAVLRMGQVREPNIPGRTNYGMVLASLPPGEWHTGWVRDAHYAIVALARSGHFTEARAALNFFINASPNVGAYKSYVNNKDYGLSLTRYFGNGVEESDWNSDGPNPETDGWGGFLWAARQYVEASGDVEWLRSKVLHDPNLTVYDWIIKKVADPIAGNLTDKNVMRADASIWEVHEAKKRTYFYTTAASARGLCDLGALAKKLGEEADTTKYKDMAAKIRTAITTLFVNRRGEIGGNLEDLETRPEDGAVAELFTWNLIRDYKGATATKTFELLERLRVASGGFKRRNVGNDPYDNNEWVLLDLRIADGLRRAGRTKDADNLVNIVVEKAMVNFNLVPELYNAVSTGTLGAYTGSIPMVGYAAGAYMMTLLDRAGLIEPNDCGDGDGYSMPLATCDGGDPRLPPPLGAAPPPGDGGVPGEAGQGGNNGGSGLGEGAAPGSANGSGGATGGENRGGDTPSAGARYESACLCTVGTPSEPAAAAMLVALAFVAAIVARGRRR